MGHEKTATTCFDTPARIVTAAALVWMILGVSPGALADGTDECEGYCRMAPWSRVITFWVNQMGQRELFRKQIEPAHFVLRP